ncbi:MAG: AraC family transcriptional regulator, partial [Bacteroidota bacterium]
MDKLTEIFYSLAPYETIAQRVAQQIGAEWKGNYYKVPPQVGSGIVEAYNFESGSLMLSRFLPKDTIRIGRQKSELRGFLGLDYILNGVSEYYLSDLVYSNQQIPQLIYGAFISTPGTESYGDFQGGMHHVHLSMLVEIIWLESFLGKKLPPLFQDNEKPLNVYYAVHSQLLPTFSLIATASHQGEFRKQVLYSQFLEILVQTFETVFQQESQKSQEAFHPDDIYRVNQVALFLQSNLSRNNTIEELARDFSINRDKLQRIFKSIYGKTIAEYTRYIRMTQAYQLLLEKRTVAEVGYQMGYSNLSHFSRAFKKVHGFNPS